MIVFERRRGSRRWPLRLKAGRGVWQSGSQAVRMGNPFLLMKSYLLIDWSVARAG